MTVNKETIHLTFHTGQQQQLVFGVGHHAVRPWTSANGSVVFTPNTDALREPRVVPVLLDIPIAQSTVVHRGPDPDRHKRYGHEFE